MAAVLHDVVEDTPVTLDDLRSGGCPEPVVRAVAALTKSKDGDETPEAYAARVAADPIALAVKRADLRDNSDEQRLAKLPEEKAERFRQKYRHMTALLDGLERSGRYRAASD